MSRMDYLLLALFMLCGVLLIIRILLEIALYVLRSFTPPAPKPLLTHNELRAIQIDENDRAEVAIIYHNSINRLPYVVSSGNNMRLAIALLAERQANPVTILLDDGSQLRVPPDTPWEEIP